MQTQPVLTLLVGGALAAMAVFGLSRAPKADLIPIAIRQAPGQIQPEAVSNAPREEAADPTRITWQPSFEAAVKKANAEGKPVMVDFFAEWCGACKTMDAQTYPDANVVAASREFVNVKVDVDKRQDIAAIYGITSLPTIAWLRGDGKPVGGIMGAYPPNDFIAAMRQAQTKFKP